MPRQKDDPEALLEDFEKYVETIKLLLVATATPGTHTPDYVSCALCWKEKQTLISVGGEEMVKLFTQVGKVTGDKVFGTGQDKAWYHHRRPRDGQIGQVGQGDW